MPKVSKVGQEKRTEYERAKSRECRAKGREQRAESKEL